MRRAALSYELLSRSELDIADEVSVAAAFERFRPWADGQRGGLRKSGRGGTGSGALSPGEHDWRATVWPRRPGVAACDCCVSRPTSCSTDAPGAVTARDDGVAPLSAYGRSKADAETAVRAACPHALIARTSAFFGPWDQANAVHHAVNAFAADRPWRAPSDQRVSPTYVPDLVNVALDLLIDGADGIWHLANDGDVSWSELARKAASALGYSDDLVEDCSTEELGLAAARPAYSVLGTDRGQRLPELWTTLWRDSLRNGTGRFAGPAEELRPRSGFLRLPPGTANTPLGVTRTCQHH